MLRLLSLYAVGVFFSTSPLFAQDEPLAKPIAAIKAVGKEGAGNVEAMAAFKVIVSQGQTALPVILAGLDDASPLAANWLRSAFEATLQREQDAGRKIDLAPLTAFLKDTTHSGAGRRLAYETIVKLDPASEAKLAPTFLNDPGAELRRDSVALLLTYAQKALDEKNPEAAISIYRNALKHARDKDQVQLAADRLKKLGVVVDLTRHFGFITQWSVIGPFDNVKNAGFHAVYPPDKEVNLEGEAVGKDNQKVVWKKAAADQPLGVLDLTKVLGPLKGAVAYAHTVVESPDERRVEVRCGSNNAVRIVLNGKEIYFRDEYHHGMQMDQHVGKGVLKAGKNEILVKVYQNEQTEPWAQLWSFQLRVCDPLGGATPLVPANEKK